MKKIVLFFLVSFIFFRANSQTIIFYWNVSTQTNFGTTPLPAAGVSPCVSNGGLVRGSGVSMIGAAADRGWGGSGFDYVSSSAAIAANAFVTTQLTVSEGYSIALSEISPIEYMRTAEGPAQALVQYSLNGGSFVDITTVSFPSTSITGASALPVTLSGITELQNLTVGTTVTFRIVPYGASSNSGAWYIYDKGISVGPDLAVSAVVTNLLRFFYSKPTGDLSLESSWGTNPDGSGFAPSNFTTDNRIYRLINRETATVLSNWTVSGNNTQLFIGDSSNLTDFSPAAGITFTLGQGASMIVTPQSSVSVPATATINLADNNLVTLASTISGTAHLGVIDGTLTGAGNVTVERAIPSNGRKSYTMVSSPVNAPSISNSWQEGGVNSNGYGTIITGATGTISNGFDAESASGLASIFTYDDTQAAGSRWRSITSTAATTLGAGKGFLLYVRGNRTVSPSATAPVNGDATLRANGAIVQGNVTISSLVPGAGKFTMIANPYPSAINWVGKADGSTRDITLNNLDDIFYVYDPSLGVFASYNGATNVLSPSNSKQPTKYIQSGQAFFVKANAANPSITFNEAAKVNTVTATSNTVFEEVTPRPQINLNVYKAADNDFADGVVALFDNNFKAGIAKEDAVKFDNFNENISLIRNGEKLSIEGRPLVKDADTLFVGLNNFSKTAYKLIVDAVNLKNVTAVLIDKYAGTTKPLNAEGSTTYNFTVNADATSAANDRFMITFGNTTSGNIADAIDSNNDLYVKLSPNPVSNQLLVRFKTATSENTIIKVVNNLGQTVRTVNAGKVNQGNITISTNSLSAGLYTVQLVSGDKKVITQKIVKE